MTISNRGHEAGLSAPRVSLSCRRLRAFFDHLSVARPGLLLRPTVLGGHAPGLSMNGREFQAVNDIDPWIHVTALDNTNSRGRRPDALPFELTIIPRLHSNFFLRQDCPRSTWRETCPPRLESKRLRAR